MYMNDLRKVLKIIREHDEDDAESAEADYQESGFDNQFVLEQDEIIIGVTGYREVPATDHTAWLSWTYLDEAHRGKGLGKKMVFDLLQILREKSARKIFVKVSDYRDDEKGNIYDVALKMYKSLGFQHELTGNDFYDEGENQLMLSFLFQEQNSDTHDELQIKDEKPIMRFNGLFEIADTEGSFTFSWVVNEKRRFFEKRSFSANDLTVGLNAVKDQGGRRVFLTFPSNLVLIHAPLKGAGFKFVGRLEDYYERGVHELHFSHDLLNLNHS